MTNTIKKRRVARLVLMLAWVCGILVPLASMRRFSSSYRIAFDWVFRTHASHVLMHTFLYGILAWLLASFVLERMRTSGVRFGVIVLVGVLAAAVLQEAIQMISERSPLGSDEIFDLCVDLNGGMLGLLLFLWHSDRRAESTADAGPGDGRC